jgi:hypothetical protein
MAAAAQQGTNNAGGPGAGAGGNQPYIILTGSNVGLLKEFGKNSIGTSRGFDGKLHVFPVFIL